jgi:hypothetical protein
LKGIIKRHKILLIVLAVLIIFIIVAVILFTNINMEGYLVNYLKADENDGHTVYTEPEEFLNYEYQLFNMSEKEAKDVIKHPDNYTAFWVGIEIRNKENHTIYNLKANLTKKYDNLWFDTSSLCEWPLDLEANGEYKDTRVLVIIKTNNLSDNEIDKLIRSINIKISASDCEGIPAYASMIIGFKNQ